MTFQVYKSQVPANFAELVEKYRVAREQWAKRPEAPPPTSHPFIENSIKRIPHGEGQPDTYTADYVVIDDTPTPPPPPTLAEKKAVMISESRQKEMADIDSIIPMGKRRLLDLDYQAAALVQENDRTNEQRQVIAQYEGLQKKIREIQYEAARREAAIEDMSE